MPDNKITKTELENMVKGMITDANKPITDALEPMNNSIKEIQDALADIRKNKPLAHGEVLDRATHMADTVRLFKIAKTPTKFLNEDDLKWAKEYQDRIIEEYKVDATFDTGTTTQGGYLLGVLYIKDVIEELAKAAVIRPLCTVVPVGMKTGKQAAVTAKISASRGSEETATNAVVDTFDQYSYSLTRLDINVLYSREMELFDNTTEGLYNMLTRQMAEAINDSEEADWLDGTGSSEPEGVLRATLSITGVDAGGGAPDYNGMVDMYYGMPARYRTKAVWVIGGAVQGALRKIVDDNHRPLWIEGFSDANPNRIFGRPVVESEHMTDTDIILGDFSYYHIFEPQKMWLVATSEGHTLVSKRQVYIGAWKFNDGKVMLANAFRIYDNIAL